jgi:hypothetical protein
MKKYIVMTVALVAVVAHSALAEPMETSVSVLRGTEIATQKYYSEDGNPEKGRWKDNLFLIIGEASYGPDSLLEYITPPVLVYFWRGEGGEKLYNIEQPARHEEFSYSNVLRAGAHRGIAFAAYAYGGEGYADSFRGHLASNNRYTTSGRTVSMNTCFHYNENIVYEMHMEDSKGNLKRSSRLSNQANRASAFGKGEPGTLENGVMTVIAHLEARGYESDEHK